MSPAVVASWFTEQRGKRPVQLQLLVLWRGTPGWFLVPGSLISGQRSSGNGRGGAGILHHVISYGTFRFTLDYEPSKRVVVIDGTTVDLTDDNVVLVDDVDGAAGPRVTHTITIPRAMPGSAGQVGVVLGQSPEIMSFLRCDSRPADARWQANVERLCLENIGK